MYQVRYKEDNINVLLRRFKTRAEAETYINIEETQMEFAEPEGHLYIKNEVKNER